MEWRERVASEASKNKSAVVCPSARQAISLSLSFSSPASLVKGVGPEFRISLRKYLSMGPPQRSRVIDNFTPNTIAPREHNKHKKKHLNLKSLSHTDFVQRFLRNIFKKLLSEKKKFNISWCVIVLDVGWISLQGAELIRVSKFYKDSKEGRFISYIHDDVRTLYDAFRKGAKESSEFCNILWKLWPCSITVTSPPPLKSGLSRKRISQIIHETI